MILDDDRKLSTKQVDKHKKEDLFDINPNSIKVFVTFDQFVPVKSSLYETPRFLAPVAFTYSDNMSRENLSLDF